MSQPLVFVKLGGRVLEGLIANPTKLTWPSTSEARMCFVHGGGAAINEMAEALGLEFEFVDGQRKTSPEVVDIVELVLRGKMNPSLVRALGQAGLNSVGLSASDNRIFDCELENPKLGLVGKVKKVNAAPIRLLLDSNYVPVVAPLGYFESENRSTVNCNADVGAIALAKELGPEHVIFLSDTDGLLDGEGNTLGAVNSAQVQNLIQKKVIQGGMLVKMQSILSYLEKHKKAKVWLLNGTQEANLSDVLNAEALNYGTCITY